MSRSSRPSQPSQSNSAPVDGAEINTSLIVGTLVGEPEQRPLPSGSLAVSFSVTVRTPGSKTTSIPMVWYDPPKRISRLAVGGRVVARGAVVRRFYQAGGGLGSSTEVVVADAAPAGSATARRIAAVVAAELTAAAGSMN